MTVSFFELDIKAEEVSWVSPFGEYDYEMPNSIYHLSLYKLASNDIVFPDLQLHSIEHLNYENENPYTDVKYTPGKLSDFLLDYNNFGGRGFIVSNKVEQILRGYKLGDHRFNEVNIVDENGTFVAKYFYLQLLQSTIYTFIDYSSTTFVKFDIVQRYTPKIKVEIEDHNHFLATISEMKRGEGIRLKELAVQK